MEGGKRSLYGILLTERKDISCHLVLLKFHQKAVSLSPALSQKQNNRVCGWHGIPTCQKASNAQIYSLSQLKKKKKSNKLVQSAPFIFQIPAWILTKWGPEHWQRLTNLSTKSSVNTTVSNDIIKNFSSVSPALFQCNSAQKAINYRTNVAGYICTAFLTCNWEDDAA